jgi:hypothetical protein
MAKAVLSLTLVLSDIEEDALLTMLGMGEAFDEPINTDCTSYAEHFSLTDIRNDLRRFLRSPGSIVLNLTGQQLVKLNRALKAYSQMRPAQFIRSPLWAIQAEIENLPTHRIKE